MRFICAAYDQSVVPRHPRTNEPMRPPRFVTAIVDEDDGWWTARLTALNISTGWKATIWTEDVGGEQAEEDRDTVRE